MFAESVRAAAAGREPPEDGYRGAYVTELATWLRRAEPTLLDREDVDALGRACVTWMLRGVPGSRTLPGIRPSLADLRVHFDVWFSEESLHRWGAVACGHAPARGRRIPGAQGRRALLPGSGGRGRGQGPGRPEERRHVGLFRFGRRLLCRQDRTRIRPVDRRARRRPSWLRGACAQRARGPGPAAGALRGAALPARLHHEGGRGGQEQQARRELRHDRRGDGRDRRGRRPEGSRSGRAALLLPVAERQLQRGVRYRAGEEEVDGQPRLLRPVRPRAALLDPAQGARAGARASRGAARASQPRLARPSRRARDEPEARRLSGGARRGRTAARAASHCLLRPGACARLSELLHAPQERA